MSKEKSMTKDINKLMAEVESKVIQKYVFDKSHSVVFPHF